MAGETLTIRAMQMEDIDSVVSLEARVFPTPWDAATFRHELRAVSASLYMVAEHAGRLVGYMGANQIGQEVHITNMAVEPESRMRGIAAAMMLACIARGIERGARWMTLEVRESNDVARCFYLKFGFRDLGMRMGYYVDTGEHAVIMATGDILTPDYHELVLLIQEGERRWEVER